MFYERFLELCKMAGVSPSAAADACGFNRATVTAWKKKYTAGIDVDPTQEVIDKLTAHFGCSEEFLRGLPLKKKASDPISRDQLKYALFGTTDVDDAILEEVKKFAQFRRQNH